MDSQENEMSTDELTLRSVAERIKQATDPILSRVEGRGIMRFVSESDWDGIRW